MECGETSRTLVVLYSRYEEQSLKVFLGHELCEDYHSDSTIGVCIFRRVGESVPETVCMNDRIAD